MNYFKENQCHEYDTYSDNKNYVLFEESDEMSQPKNIIPPTNINMNENDHISIIWVSNVNEMKDLKEYWGFLLSTLSPDEKKKVESFRLEPDRWRSFISLQLQKCMIRSYLGTNRNDDCPYEIRRTKENKPYAYCSSRSLKKWNYNVSHHGDYVAIASHKTLIIGVDIMTLTKPNSRYVQSDDAYFAIFKNHFTAIEMAHILEQPTEIQRYRMFFINWSLKESFVKAIGCGISYELKSLCFKITFNTGNTSGKAVLRSGDSPTHAAIQSNWRFQFYMLDDTHVMSVALGPTQEVIESYSQEAWQDDTKDTNMPGSSSNTSSNKDAPIEDMTSLSLDKLSELEPELSSPPKRKLNLDSCHGVSVASSTHSARNEANLHRNDPFQLPAWELQSVESLLSEEDFESLQKFRSTSH